MEYPVPVRAQCYQHCLLVCHAVLRYKKEHVQWSLFSTVTHSCNKLSWELGSSCTDTGYSIWMYRRIGPGTVFIEIAMFMQSHKLCATCMTLEALLWLTAKWPQSGDVCTLNISTHCLFTIIHKVYKHNNSPLTLLTVFDRNTNCQRQAHNYKSCWNAFWYIFAWESTRRARTIAWKWTQPRLSWSSGSWVVNIELSFHWNHWRGLFSNPSN